MSRLPPPTSFQPTSRKRNLDEALDIIDHADGPSTKKLTRSTAGRLTQPKVFALNGSGGGEGKKKNLPTTIASGVAKRTVSQSARPAPAMGGPKPLQLPTRIRTASTSVHRSKQPPPPQHQENPKDDRLALISNRLVSIESARQRDHDEMKALMAAERAKRLELEVDNNLVALSGNHQVEETRAELDEMKRRWSNEAEELKMEVERVSRIKRDVEEELKHAQHQLSITRGTNDTLLSEMRRKDEELLDSRVHREVLSNKLHDTQTSLTTLESRLATAESRVIELQVYINSIEAQKVSLEERLICERERADMERANALQNLEHLMENRQVELRLQKDTEVTSLRAKLTQMEKGMRMLRNEMMESRGCIRVVARIRPLIPTEHAQLKEPAHFAYPDSESSKREVVLSITSPDRGGEWKFSFDRVFTPSSGEKDMAKSQMEVFEELEALTTSVVDGWSCCVFAYGVTGSGKSYTMEGPGDHYSPGSKGEDERGLIPRAVEHLFREMKDREEVGGWVYTVDGAVLEVYNEGIHDLLEGSAFDENLGKTKTHEIKHDPKTGETRVTDVSSVRLGGWEDVQALLKTASAKRTTASTLVNDRSSRSHCVFMLTIRGVCEDETTYSTLNLVDLAGSERINVSGTGNDKDRLKETQCINKSLSALGDVIAALGERGTVTGGEKEKERVHIPYRNSKLTYLLQNSLGGNSKTLMVLNVSPLAIHASESLTSLRFATKVNNTSVGGAVRGVGGRK